MAEKVDSLVVAREARRLLAQRPKEKRVLDRLVEVFGVSKRTVSRLLKAEGVVLRVPQYEVPELGVLRALYLDEDRTVGEIAERFGVSVRTAERWLASADIRKGGAR